MDPEHRGLSKVLLSRIQWRVVGGVHVTCRNVTCTCAMLHAHVHAHVHVHAHAHVGPAEGLRLFCVVQFGP